MVFLTTNDDVKLFYENSGEGETLIFTHGLNSSHLANKDFYDIFREDYNVIVYDQRGHGNSSKSKFF